MTARLLKSIDQFNVDSLPIFLVCPSRDVQIFQQFSSTRNLRIVPEESMNTMLFTEQDPETKTGGVGYLNQQIFKLSFSTLGYSERYLCLDSDAVFVRPFSKWDFVNERTNLPYLFQSEDRELRIESSYFGSWESREVALRKIEDVLNVQPGDPFIAVHGFQVFSRQEIEAMMFWLRENAGILSFKEMLAVSQYEFNWYTTFVRNHSTQFVSREPIFKTFHSSREFAKALFFKVSEDDHSRGYVGVCVNGNFQHGRGTRLPLSLRSNASVVGAMYLSFGEIFRLSRDSTGALAIYLALAAPKLVNRLILYLKRRFDSAVK